MILFCLTTYFFTLVFFLRPVLYELIVFCYRNAKDRHFELSIFGQKNFSYKFSFVLYV